MGYLIGALIVVFGIALVISGATGSAGALFSSVTGKSTTTSSSDTAASNTAGLLQALSVGSGGSGLGVGGAAIGGAASTIQGNPT